MNSRSVNFTVFFLTVGRDCDFGKAAVLTWTKGSRHLPSEPPTMLNPGAPYIEMLQVAAMYFPFIREPVFFSVTFHSRQGSRSSSIGLRTRF